MAAPVGIGEASGIETTPLSPSLISNLAILFLISFDSLCPGHSPFCQLLLLLNHINNNNNNIIPIVTNSLFCTSPLLRALHVLLCLVCTKAHEAGTIFIPIFQMTKYTEAFCGRVACLGSHSV